MKRKIVKENNATYVMYFKTELLVCDIFGSKDISLIKRVFDFGSDKIDLSKYNFQYLESKEKWVMI